MQLQKPAEKFSKCYTTWDLTDNICRVDIIEAGFPVASPDDFEAVRAIAIEVGNLVDEDGYVPVICGLSRTKLRQENPTLRSWSSG